MPTTAKKATRAPAPAPSEPEPGRITAGQMRHLHALLRDHGITGDAAVHDYLATWLTEAGEPPFASRSELSTVNAARIIAELEAADVPEATSLSTRTLRRLRAPFSEQEVGKLPRSTCKACSDSPRKRCDNHQWVTRCPECRNSHSSAVMHIDFVGHADVTARLLDVDPGWTWAPMATDPNGFPILDGNGGLWINLTVGGVTRPGYGEGSSGQQRGGDSIKVAIGDALRNAAMRFGVALDLWAKGDRAWAQAEKHDPTRAPLDPPAPVEPPPPYDGPSVGQTLANLTELAHTQATTLEGITAKFMSDNDYDDITHVPAPVLADLETAIRAYIAAHPGQHEQPEPVGAGA